MKELNINAEDRLKIEVVFNLFKFCWTFSTSRFCRHNILNLLHKIDIGEELEEQDEHIFEYCMILYNKLFSSSSDISESDKSATLKELIDINNKFPEHTMCIEEINEIVTYKRKKFDTVPNNAHIYEDEEGKLYCLVDRNREFFGTKMYIFNKDKNE